MKRLLPIAAAAALAACSLQKGDEPSGENYLAEDLQVFFEPGNATDTIRMVDNFGMKDRFVQTWKVENGKMDFRVKGDWFYLDMKVSVYPGPDGGFVEMTTSYETLDVYYNTSVRFGYKDGSLVHGDDCKLNWIKSMYLDDAKYFDVLVFSPECVGGKYKFDKMYYSATDGLVRVDVNDSVSLFRVLEKE
jgi:hypothetical protein